jgi:hypothetical protein
MEWELDLSRERILAFAKETWAFHQRPIFIVAILATLCCLQIQGPWVYISAIIAAMTFANQWWRVLAVAVVLLIASMWFHSYQVRWEGEAGQRFTDSFYGWSGKHYQRECWAKDYSWSAEGPIAGEGRLHGKWKYVATKPDFQVTTKFFWYGEECSEGDFMLKNRR